MTDMERAKRALRARGWGVAICWSCNADELRVLADMVDEQGRAKPGLPRRLDAWLEEYYERRKAAGD